MTILESIYGSKPIANILPCTCGGHSIRSVRPKRQSHLVTHCLNVYSPLAYMLWLSLLLSLVPNILWLSVNRILLYWIPVLFCRGVFML